MNSQNINANSPSNLFNYHSSFKTKSGQEVSLEGRQVSEEGKSEINSYKISLLFDKKRILNLDLSQQQDLENLFSEKKIIVAESGILLNTSKVEDVATFLNLAKNLISENETRELQKFIHSSKLDIGDQYIDEDLSFRTEKMLNENVCEMPAGTPFSGTDLVILKDSYTGPMPKNGIKESDFKQMCTFFQSIEKNETSIKIDIEYAPIILNLIKTLLTRDIGRRLIQTCASHGHAVTIKNGEAPGYYSLQKSGLSGPKFTPETMHSNEVTLNFSDDYYYFYHGMKPNGEEVVSDGWPLHVMLAHELIHHLHYSTLIEDRSTNPTLGISYHDMAEQRAITGFKREPEITDFISNEKLAEYNDLFEQGLDTTEILQSLEPLGQKKEVYYEFNERAVMNAFTDSKNVFYPRVGHTGVRRTSAEMEKASIENLANKLKSLKNGSPVEFLKLVAEAKDRAFQLPLSVQSLITQVINDLLYASENPASPNYQILQKPENKALLDSVKSFRSKRDVFLNIKENALAVIRNPENWQFLRNVDGAMDELIDMWGHDKEFMGEVSKYGL